MTSLLKRLFVRLVVQPPLLYRVFFPEAIWRLKVPGRKVAYITFDDGPTPEATPQVLDILARYGIKATFFMVGDNARRHPQLRQRVEAEGHVVGNHTMHHVQGSKCSVSAYLDDVREAHDIIGASLLFRPPHGWLRWGQSKVIRRHYNLIMYDVVTRDYARLITPDEVVENVKRHTRNGSIIVFHDSQKSARNVIPALPRALQWLIDNGFELRTLGM